MAMKKLSVPLALMLGLCLVGTACSNTGSSPQSGSSANANKDAASSTAANSTAASSDAANAKPAEQVVLNFVNWASAEEATKDKISQVIAQFEKENPAIKIKSVPIPFSDIENQLTIMTTAGNAPDVAQVENSVGITLAAMGALEPVEGLMSKEFAADVNKSYYESGLYADKHYLIPWGGGTNGFWYNKKLMQQAGLDPNSPPKTLKELDEAMAKIKKLNGDIVPLQYDTSARPFAIAFQWPWMMEMGGNPFDDKQAQVGTLSSYAQWLRDLVAKGYTLPGKKLGEFRPLGAQNRLAFAVDAPFYKGTIQSFDKAITDQVFYDTWGVTTFPAGNDGKSYTVGGSDHYMAVFKASKHKQEAAKFLEYLANSDVSMKNYIIPMGYLPVTNSALQRFKTELDNPVTKAYMEKIVPTSVVPPFGSNFTKASSILATSLQSVITSNDPIDGILSKTQAKLEGVISGK